MVVSIWGYNRLRLARRGGRDGGQEEARPAPRRRLFWKYHYVKGIFALLLPLHGGGTPRTAHLGRQKISSTASTRHRCRHAGLGDALGRLRPGGEHACPSASRCWGRPVIRRKGLNRTLSPRPSLCLSAILCGGSPPPPPPFPRMLLAQRRRRYCLNRPARARTGQYGLRVLGFVVDSTTGAATTKALGSVVTNFFARARPPSSPRRPWAWPRWRRAAGGQTEVRQIDRRRASPNRAARRRTARRQRGRDSTRTSRSRDRVAAAQGRSPAAEPNPAHGVHGQPARVVAQHHAGFHHDDACAHSNSSMDVDPRRATCARRRLRAHDDDVEFIEVDLRFGLYYGGRTLPTDDDDTARVPLRDGDLSGTVADAHRRTRAVGRARAALPLDGRAHARRHDVRARHRAEQRESCASTSTSTRCTGASGSGLWLPSCRPPSTTR